MVATTRLSQNYHKNMVTKTKIWWRKQDYHKIITQKMWAKTKIWWRKQNYHKIITKKMWAKTKKW